MSHSSGWGRFGNVFIQNIMASIIAEKHDLYIEYPCYFNDVEMLGIKLFVGKQKYNSSINLTISNFFELLEKTSLETNIYGSDFFQQEPVIQYLYKYLHSDKVKHSVIQNNPFNERYNKNNDAYIHIRLGDVEQHNPGVNYYLKAISATKCDSIYISTDNKDHSIIKTILDKCPNAVLLDYNEIKTVQFASTCKYIILSHGSFSAIIGYLAFFSTIYYPTHNHLWYGKGLFSIDGWNEIVDYSTTALT